MRKTTTRKFFITIILVLLLLFISSCNNNGNGTGPGQNGEENKMYINKIEVVTENPKQYEKLELKLTDTQEFKQLEINPFNYREFKVMAEFEAPSKNRYSIPAFWYHDYETYLNENWPVQPQGIHGIASKDQSEPQGLDVIDLIGDPHFRIRYFPLENGEYNVKLSIYIDEALVQTLTSSLVVAENQEEFKGLIQVEEKHKRNFVFANGDTFIPVGQNTAWYTSSTRQTEDYKIWFQKMRENEANFGRIWMAPWSYALHWGVDHDDFTSKQGAAARLDKTLEIAEEYEIYFMLALLNHGQFSAVTNPKWQENPYNVINGGFLDLPSKFFSSKRAKETYKQQLLYIIARYGYSPYIMAWELFNEVDWTDQFNEAIVFMWHSEMAAFLKENDPYHHLVTTSYKYRFGGAYTSKNIDFTNPHDYGYNGESMLNRLVPVLDESFFRYNKPVIHSEIGVNWQSGPETYAEDPTGISLKQAQWAGIMGGGAGAAMNWWWDSWVHPHDLYYRFKGAGVYAKQMDMTGDSYTLLHKLSGVSLNNNNVGILGYIIDDRIYGYLADKRWTNKKPTVASKEVSVSIPFKNGSYIVDIYNTDTGEIMETKTIVISNQKLELNVTFVEDIAFIARQVK